MISTSERRGFTLIELMVVVAMIAAIMAAMTVSVAGARERAAIEKARTEVKAISQAILAYENYADGGLPEIGSSGAGAEVNASNFGFLLGKGPKDRFNNDIPVLLQAALSSGGKMLDPWGMPYTVVIAKGTIGYEKVKQINTGFSLPNIHRLSKEERQ